MGDTVAVQVSTTNQTFDGKIVRFSDQIDTDTRTMHTEIDVPNPKYSLVAGMYATVQIPLHTVQNVLTVPVQSRTGLRARVTAPSWWLTTITRSKSAT